MSAVKIVVSGVSMLLVAVVVITVVAVINSGEEAKNDMRTSIAMKGVTTYCDGAQYKDTCAYSVALVAKDPNATVKDFLWASVNYTISHIVTLNEDMEKRITDNTLDPYNALAIEECTYFLEDAAFYLRNGLDLINKTELAELPAKTSRLLNWIGAAYAFHSICLEQIEDKKLVKQITEESDIVNHATHNAVTLVSNVTEILKAFEHFRAENNNNTAMAEQNNTSRRLLEATEIDHHDDEGYPSWFSGADRKLLASGRHVDVNCIVAQDGTGQYKTIMDAVDAYPKDSQKQKRFVIYVKAGVYDEQVIIGRRKTYVYMYGDGPGKTIITGNKDYDNMHIPPSNTSTFVSKGKGFIAKGLTIRNTAGKDGSRAVALRVQSDQSAFFDCSIEGYHDTLNYMALRSFYRNCIISGTADFIFGMGSAYIQNSLIIVRKPTDTSQVNTVTADGRAHDKLNTGVVIQHCKIVPDKELFPDRFSVKTYLGRPWRNYASTTIMQTELGDFIRPEGWLIWKGQRNHESCTFAEFENGGPGAGVRRRDKKFKKFKVLSKEDADKHTLGPFLLADEDWLSVTGAPYKLGLWNPAP